MRLLTELLRHLLPGVIRPIQVLWNEVIGFVFVVFATFIGFSTWRRAQSFSGDVGGILIIVASCLFSALLLWFGISSFLKARKISRS
jgi:F0F1-type ATP synthase assembly protein I